MTVRHRARPWALLAGLLLAILATTLAPSTASAETRHDRIVHARKVALRQSGDPSRYGAEGPRRFDCSGLVYFSYRRAGFDVPRTSSAQASSVRHIRKSHLQRGDFMFFRDGGGVYHVGIFLARRDGHVVMLHAPSPGERVRRDKPWTSDWFAGTLRRR